MKYVDIDGVKIYYNLTRKKMKNIRIRVTNPEFVEVSCPYYVKTEDVERFIRQQKDFIIKSMETMSEREEKNVEGLNIKDGETVYVFGKQKKLNVQRRDGFLGVFADDANVYIYEGENTNARQLYMLWRKEELERTIKQLCKEIGPKMAAPVPEKTEFGDYTSFWGENVKKTKTLKFSYRLFEHDLEDIEYVVVHEFAHFFEMNHSPAFWAIVAKYIPDYKARRKRLNGK